MITSVVSDLIVRMDCVVVRRVVAALLLSLLLSLMIHEGSAIVGVSWPTVRLSRVHRDLMVKLLVIKWRLTWRWRKAACRRMMMIT